MPREPIPVGGQSPPLAEGDKINFETIKLAGRRNDLALVSAIRKSDRMPVALVTAMGFENGEYVMSPLAVMVEDNPYELFEDPTAEPVKPKKRAKSQTFTVTITVDTSKDVRKRLESVLEYSSVREALEEGMGHTVHLSLSE